MKIFTTAFAFSFSALSLVACGSSAPDELDEAPAVPVAASEVSVNAEGACPFWYKCAANGAWSSTLAACKATCATTCGRQEYNNGHCILH